MAPVAAGVAVLGDSRASTSMLPRCTVGVGALAGNGDGAVAAAAAADGAGAGVASAAAGGAALHVHSGISSRLPACAHGTSQTGNPPTWLHGSCGSHNVCASRCAACKHCTSTAGRALDHVGSQWPVLRMAFPRLAFFDPLCKLVEQRQRQRVAQLLPACIDKPWHTASERLHAG